MVFPLLNLAMMLVYLSFLTANEALRLSSTNTEARSMSRA
jgi:hypothetical protein